MHVLTLRNLDHVLVICALHQQSFWGAFKVSSKKASTVLIFEVIK